jgi:alpha-galactosidase
MHPRSTPRSRRSSCSLVSLLIGACSFACTATNASSQTGQLKISLNTTDGSYSVGASDLTNPVLKATAAAKVNGRWLRAADYSHFAVSKQTPEGELGPAEEWIVRYTGQQDEPELLVRLRAYRNVPFGEAQVTVRNTTSQPIQVQAIRVIDATGVSLLNLGGPPSSDRVLSDSFSEDRPAMQIRDLANAEDHLHRGVGSQLVYNLQSHKSWFIGALTSDKFLSVLRLHMAPDDPTKTASYEVDSTGTTELLKENSLLTSAPEDHIELSLPLAPGAELSSERMLFSVGDNYHQQLETYGRLIRDLHHGRVTAPTPLGWWSWTAYYFGLNEGTALTNAEWLSQHLKKFGYDFFHIDEGYQYARGEYATPDAVAFPNGVAELERKATAAGLTPGIWTAPFEVSERSWIYEHHPEWLVHNAKGDPIHIGLVTDGKDHLYALDPTHPGAQAYLRNTYSTLTKEWGIRYIKLDFMEDSAVEGFYHQPNTTALEAQRIGLKTIRDAVGEQVLLDKDGCELLNPVGIVDMGRISQDTGHTFSSSKDTASGIAARYYMNRNYFLADPDAFTVSTQTVDDQSWHGGSKPLTLDEAKVSIALSAVSGGLFEDGDDLPTLDQLQERVALLEAPDVLDMVHLGRASTPLDLMSYQPEDLQPSLFLIKQSDRQSVLTIFNWTDKERAHHVSLSDLNLAASRSYTVTDVLAPQATAHSIDDSLDVTQPPHSVRMLKLVDQAIPPHPPIAKKSLPSTGTAGEKIDFIAEQSSPNDPIVHYRWDFGDGVMQDGPHASHAYTHDGTFTVTLFVTGLDGVLGQSNSSITIDGAVSTKFHPEAQRRLQ